MKRAPLSCNIGVASTTRVVQTPIFAPESFYILTRVLELVLGHLEVSAKPTACEVPAGSGFRHCLLGGEVFGSSHRGDEGAGARKQR